MIKVAKFGGSSLANKEQFQKVKAIIANDLDKKFIVVSAPGKDALETSKITDLLYLIKAHIDYNVDYSKILEQVKERYFKIYNGLNLTFDLESEFQTIENQLKKGAKVEYIVSRGEYLSAKMMADYLGYHFLDAKDILMYNFDKSFNKELSLVNLKKYLKDHDNFVMPGFYAAYKNNELLLMSRGGSDLSGSLLADLLNADLYENYTDVDGIMVVDPRIVDNPKIISEISYKELRELSYMGARVLHEGAIKPLQEKNIPIVILNTNNPDQKGTIIRKKALSDDNLIKGIAGRKDFHVISIYKSHMSEEIGTVQKALEILKNYQISVEHIPSGIDSFSLIIADEYFKDNIYEIINHIKIATEADEIKLIDNISLIAIVGENMANNPGTSGKVFYILGKHHVNIKMISQSTDEMNIIIGVDNNDYQKTIEIIYDHFIKAKDIN